MILDFFPENALGDGLKNTRTRVRVIVIIIVIIVYNNYSYNYNAIKILNFLILIWPSGKNFGQKIKTTEVYGCNGGSLNKYDSFWQKNVRFWLTVFDMWTIIWLFFSLFEAACSATAVSLQLFDLNVQLLEQSCRALLLSCSHFSLCSGLKLVLNYNFS